MKRRLAAIAALLLMAASIVLAAVLAVQLFPRGLTVFACRVRVAPQHPGASPSATIPAGGWDAVRGILRVTAFGSL